ncbi:MAG: c-type cytochrome [Caldilineaceae bacterium]
MLLMLSMLTLGLAACGDNDEEPTPAPAPQAAAPAQADVPSADAAGDAANGQKIFSTTCAACHGPAGEGVQGLGKDMTKSEF